MGVGSVRSNLPDMMAVTMAQKLLLINPNTSEETTRKLSLHLQPFLPSGFELDVRTVSKGAPYIACEASHAVAASALLETWADYLCEQQAPDGVLIGCFGDPGLFALRESSACKVTGLAEASFIEASQRGSFAIVTGGQRWKPMLQRLALSLGFGEALRHIETVTPTGAMLQADPGMALQCLRHACQAATLPGVQSIILGGAGLAGMASLIQPHVDLPLIDSVEAGLRVLIDGSMPAPVPGVNGFVAQLHHLSPSMLSLQNKNAL